MVQAWCRYRRAFSDGANVGVHPRGAKAFVASLLLLSETSTTALNSIDKIPKHKGFLPSGFA